MTTDLMDETTKLAGVTAGVRRTTTSRSTEFRVSSAVGLDLLPVRFASPAHVRHRRASPDTHRQQPPPCSAVCASSASPLRLAPLHAVVTRGARRWSQGNTDQSAMVQSARNAGPLSLFQSPAAACLLNKDACDNLRAVKVHPRVASETRATHCLLPRSTTFKIAGSPILLMQSADRAMNRVGLAQKGVRSPPGRRLDRQIASRYRRRPGGAGLRDRPDGRRCDRARPSPSGTDRWQLASSGSDGYDEAG